MTHKATFTGWAYDYSPASVEVCFEEPTCLIDLCVGPRRERQYYNVQRRAETGSSRLSNPHPALVLRSTWVLSTVLSVSRLLVDGSELFCMDVHSLRRLFACGKNARRESVLWSWRCVRFQCFPESVWLTGGLKISALWYVVDETMQFMLIESA